MKLQFTIYLLAVASILLGQDSVVGVKKVQPEALKADLIILKNNLEAIHPGLYTYTPKSEFDAFFVNLEHEIKGAMTEADFYRLLLPLNNLIRNGHTLIIPPESWSQYVARHAVHIPFDIYTENEKIFILRNYSEEKNIFEGDEVTHIDDMPAKEILDKLLDGSNKDGYNTTYPLVLIHQDFSEYFANIIGAKKEYSIEIKGSEGVKSYLIQGQKIEDIRLASIERYQYDKRAWYASIDNPPLTYELEDGIAILTLPTFNIDNIKDNGIDYEVFFKHAFQDIEKKRVNNLIIDLRGNGGGYGDVGTELFSYLHDKPFRLIKDIYTITRKIPNKKFYDGNLFWQSIQMKFALRKISKTKYVPRKFAARRNHLSLDYKQPSFPHYKGKVYVLTDGWVFSASAMFAGLVKNYYRGLFIGEETGGNPKVQIGDFEQMLTLPGSGLRIRIPLFFEEMDVDYENPEQGIIPDFFQRNNISQEIKKEDHILKWTIHHIQAEKH